MQVARRQLHRTKRATYSQSAFAAQATNGLRPGQRGWPPRVLELRPGPAAWWQDSRSRSIAPAPLPPAESTTSAGPYLRRDPATEERRRRNCGPEDNYFDARFAFAN